MAMVLTLYSFGMVMTRQSGITTIATFLGLLLDQSPASLRQRLREWNYEADQKRGQQRRTLDVSASFVWLLRWVMQDFALERQLVLGMDVTYLGERFTILCISVLYGGCAIPVAWRILPGNTKGEWHPLWVELLNQLTPAVQGGWQVFVLTDRGLYSKRLFRAIKQRGWHPMMRIRAQGLCRRERHKTWKALDRLARPGMGIWCQRMVCFKGDPLVCTLLIQWDARYHEACLIVTDLPPAQVRHNLYGLRVWIEAGFKDLKRGGLHWEQTKMTDAARAERLWLVLAVAVLWLVRTGDAAHLLWQTHRRNPLPPSPLSCMTLGWLTLLVAALRRPPVHYAIPDLSLLLLSVNRV